MIIKLVIKLLGWIWICLNDLTAWVFRNEVDQKNYTILVESGDSYALPYTVCLSVAQIEIRNIPYFTAF